MNIWIVTLSIFTVIGRFLIEPRLTDIPTFNLTYEAISHLFVGGLFGAWLTGRDKAFLSLGVGLSLFELFMFIVQKTSQ